MTTFSRRNMLQLLTVMTAGSLVGCRQSKRNFTVVDHLTLPPPTTLNVVIKGLCTIEINTHTPHPETGVTVVFPDIVDSSISDMSHLYWYGNILNVPNEETSLLHPICTMSTFTLKNVPPSGMPLDKTKYLDNGTDIAFDSVMVDETNKRRFILPWPNDLQSFGIAQRKDGQPLLQDTSGRFSLLKTIATTHVLTYSINPNTAPKVTCDDMDTSWNADPQYAADNTHANLHIFAEPRTADPDHAIAAFQELMKTINVTGLTFKRFQDNEMAPPNDVAGGGLRDIDFKHLEKLIRGGEVANCVSALVFK